MCSLFSNKGILLYVFLCSSLFSSFSNSSEDTITVWAPSSHGAASRCAIEVNDYRQFARIPTSNSNPFCSEFDEDGNVSDSCPLLNLDEIDTARCDKKNDDISEYRHIVWNNKDGKKSVNLGEEYRFRNDNKIHTTIISPTENSSFFHDEAISFRTQENVIGPLELTWSSNIDGNLSTSEKFSSSSLREGTHIINLSSRPDEGAEGVLFCCEAKDIKRTIHIYPEPSVAITPPKTVTFLVGQSVQLISSAGSRGAIKWSSNIDGFLGDSKNLSVSNLSINTHVITVRYAVATTNSVKTVSDDITIEVLKAPKVEITQPVEGDVFLHGEYINLIADTKFRGTAIDNSGIQWSSSLDGELGSGSTLDTSDLSSGEHLITVNVSPEGFPASDAVTLIVTEDEEDENLADEESCEGQSFAGNPINLQTGNKVQRELDYKSNGKFPLLIKRTYNSKSNGSGLFGPKWSSNLEQYLDFENNNQTAVIRKANGATERFELIAGSWVSTRESQVSRNSLAKNANNWLYRLKNGRVEEYDLLGQLIKITSIDGYSHRYSYENKKLVKIEDDTLRSLRITYVNDLVDTITTPDDSVFQYSYVLDSKQEHKILSKITYPSIEVNGSSLLTHKTYLYEKSNFPHALTGIKDENDQRFASWDYDSYGRAVYSGHGEGSQIKNGFESFNVEYLNDTQTKVSNPFGKQSTYNYESIDGILKTTSIEGHASSNCAAAGKSLKYYSNGWVKSRTDWNGNITVYTYNTRGLVTSTKIYGADALSGGTDYSGLTPDFSSSTTWHPTLPKPDIIIQAGLTTDYDYYPNGLVMDIKKTSTLPIVAETGLQTEFENRIWHYDYTYYEGTRLASMTINGPRTDVDDITTVHYDGNGNITKTINALGHEYSFGHTSAQTQYDWKIDPNGVRTDFIYNDRGWLTDLTVSKNDKQISERYEYYANGLTKKKTKANGDFEKYEFNSAHYLTAKVNSLNERYEITPALDGGWLTKTIKDESGQIHYQQTRTTDELGRTLKMKGANGQVTDYKYDNNGNILKTTQKLDGNRELITNRSYDWANRLATVIPQGLKSAGITTHYTYENNLLTSVKAGEINGPGNHETLFIYNGFGDLLKEQSPDRGNTFYHYDFNSSLVSEKIDGRNFTETFIYDAIGRLTDKKFTNPQENQLFIYDEEENGNIGKGRLTTIEDESGKTYQVYDYLGNVINKRYRIGSNDYSITYGFGTKNQLDFITYPSGRVVNYTYNNQGKVNTVQEDKSGSTQLLAENIQYKAFGPISHIKYGNGIVDDFEYDLSYRLAQNGQWASYQYTNANQLEYAFGQMAHEQGAKFSYDDNNRIKRALWPIDEATLEPIDANLGIDVLSSVEYDYDAFSNLNSRQYKGSLNRTYYVQDQPSINTNTWVKDSLKLASNASNQLASINKVDYRELSQSTSSPSPSISNIDISFAYDRAGNLTSRTQVSSNDVFKYNNANRMSQVKNNNQIVASYTYNSSGQRVRKQADGANVEYHYGLSGELLAETDHEGKLIRELVYLNGKPLVVFDNSLRSDKPLWNNSEGEALTPEEQETLKGELDSETSYQATLNGDGSLTLILKLNGRSTQQGTTGIGFSLTDEQATSPDEFVKFAMEAYTRRVPLPIYRDKKIALPLKQDKRLEFTKSSGEITQFPSQYSWIKLDRFGDDFTLYGSNDGIDWQQLDATQAIVPRQLKLQAFALNAALDLNRMTAVEVAEPTFYFHNDLLGTPKIMTDINGIAIWKSDLAPYGESFENEFLVGNLNVGGTMTALDSNVRFPGQYADKETSLNYNYFRDYDPSTGRYIQSDPIGLRGGLNTYAYAYQNPIAYFDPDGKRPTKNPKGPNGRPLPQGEGSIGFQIGSTVMNYNPKDGATWSQTTGLGIGFFGEQCEPAPPGPEQCSIPDKKPDSYSMGLKGLGVTVKSNGQKCITVGPAIGIPVGAEWDI